MKKMKFLEKRSNLIIKKNNFLIIFKIIFCSFIFYSSILSAYSSPQLIDTISVEFVREYKEKDETEIIKGKIYYKAPANLTIKVQYPVNQWMILKDNETIIYYPDKHQAFHIIFPHPFLMPFFQMFIAVLKEDYGLTEIEYTVSNIERENNILITYWKPPEKLSKVLGEFALKYIDNKLVYVESKNPKGEIISKICYKNHVLYSGTYFPLEITINTFSNNNFTFEKIDYLNPQFNSPFPQEIIDFRIPSNVKVKEIK